MNNIITKISVAAVLIIVSVSLSAQTYDVRERVAADYGKIAGCEGAYRYDASPLTTAPKGYTPFYISHYGRHGSRYAWNDDTYIVIARVLEAARQTGSLTGMGETFYRRFMDFYKIPLINYGNLVPLGFEQHRRIAETMFEEFPEVFSNGGKVAVRSSVSQRAIASMSAFCSSLVKCSPKLEMDISVLNADMCVANPAEAPDELFRNISGELKRPSDDGTVTNIQKKHYDDVLNRLFTDRGFLEDAGGRQKFIFELFMLWSGYHNYCDEDIFEFLFTKEELVDFWEGENYRLYLSHTEERYLTIPLLEDIIDRADEALKEGGCVAHLRFGHDRALNAFTTLINIDGSGFEPDCASDVKYWFQNYNCPMACNLQFVFYRSKKNPEILFKLLRNNSEVSLPQLDPVSGPYYRWSDFVSWAHVLMAEHPQK